MKYSFKLFSLTCTAFLFGTAFAQADCQADFKALMDAHLKAGPYHVSSVTTMGDKSRESESDIVPPDRFHILSGPHEAVNQDSIFTESGAWSKVGDGKWIVIPPDMANKAEAVFKAGLSSGYPNIAGLACLGAQPIEGKSLVTYGFDFSNHSLTSNTDIRYHIKLFEDANHLPSIIVAEVDMGTSHAVATQHITYDPSITISPPQLN